METETAEEEVLRLRHENSFLQSAETLLEQKCAALDSRLEEAQARAAASEKEGGDAQLLDQLQRAQATEAELRDALKASEEKVGSGEAARVAGLEQALDEQMLATAATCEENDRLKAKLELSASALRAAEDLRQEAHQKDLYAASLEAQLEALKLEAERAKAATAALEGERAEITRRAKAEIERAAAERERAATQAAERDAAAHAALEAMRERAEAAEQRAAKLEGLLEQRTAGEEQVARARREGLARAEQLCRELAAEQELRSRVERRADEAERRAAAAETEARKAQDCAAVRCTRLESELAQARAEVERRGHAAAALGEQVAALEAELVELGAQFKASLDRSKRELGSTLHENGILRRSLVECGDLVEANLGEMLDERPAASGGFGGSVIDLGGPLRVEMLASSDPLEESSTQLMLRKLRRPRSRGGAAPRPRSSGGGGGGGGARRRTGWL